jgi:polyhydroxyalkanoate synthesis regulator phasin
MPDDTKQRNDLNKVLFMNLVMMLASSAMQQMGKLVNPMTQKAEVNLEGAQVTIDLLTMVQTKTKGNLDKDEEKMLTDLLTSLQLNYVSTAEAAAAGKKEAPAAEQPAAAASTPPPPSPPPDTDTKKDPKFRKSYGA